MADQVQFEAMRTGDCSWHPCQLSFSPNGGGLGIKYENNCSQDILMSEKEVLMRIRVRSLPLLEDDCTRIKPGDRVVCQNSEKGFFDAEIEKVLSVRHSKRAQCRLMRLANKSINDHPTISAFLESVSLNNSCFSSMSPQLTVVNDFELDLDLHDLLEKQIEGIRNSVHGSKKIIRDEILGLEANIHEQVKETDIAVPNASDSEDISTKESLETEDAPKPAKTMKKKSLFTTSDISTNAGQQRQAKMYPDLESRTTRAKIQKAKGIFTDTVERNTSVNGNNPSTVTNRRLTRSVPNKEGENRTTETTTVGTNSSSNMRRATRSSISQDAANIKTDTTKESDGDELSPEERNKKINTEGTNGSSNMRIRATRSSINQEAADMKTDTVNESDGDELPTEQKSKKRNTEGNAANNGGNSYGSKKKNPLDLNKHKLRSSPRFRS
nr:putative SAWADEE domain-containing protein [Tanacetum cinerariifolium]